MTQRNGLPAPAGGKEHRCCVNQSELWDVKDKKERGSVDSTDLDYLSVNKQSVG